MTTEDDKDWSADLKAIEDRIGGRESPQIIAPVMRDLLDKIAEDSPDRPRALRLRGILFNRCRDPEKALAHLHQARQKAIEQQNLAETIEAGREIAVVHAWRGEDRDAALALLQAVAVAYLNDNGAATASALAEAGRIELEARRFADAERLFRLVASKAAATLPPREVLRVRINLCQALNRLERHQEVLELTAALASDLATQPLEKRLAFLTLLEEARAQAGLKNFEAAAASLERARALLPADPNEFEHNEAREAAAELKLAKQDWTAIDDLKALANKYTAPNLTVRAANLRMMAAGVLFKTGQPTEAGRLLADALRRRRQGRAPGSRAAYPQRNARGRRRQASRRGLEGHRRARCHRRRMVDRPATHPRRIARRGGRRQSLSRHRSARRTRKWR